MMRSLGVVFLLLVALPAAADIGEGNGEVGLDYGWIWLDDDVFLFDSQDHIGALRGGYFFTDRLQLEGYFSFTEIMTTVGRQDVEDALDLALAQVVVNFHPGQRARWVPFLSAGVGSAYRRLAIGKRASDDEGLAWRIGAGTRIYRESFSRWAARVDVAYVSEDALGETGSHLSATIGLSVRIGANP